MKKLNNRGFSAIEIILMIVVVGLVGAVGWFVYDRQKNTEKTSSSTNSNTNQTQQETPNTEVQKEPEFSLTTELTSLNKKFTLNLPDGWAFTNDTEQDYAYALNSEQMTYKKGVPASVKNQLGHRGGGFVNNSFVISYSTEQNRDYFSSSENKGTLMLNSGVTANKYLFVSDGSGPDGSKGTKSYGYQVNNDKGSVIIRYIIELGTNEQLDLIEASIKTIRL